MKDNETLYDVTISKERDESGKFMPMAVYCNPMTKYEIQEYLDKIKDIHTIPRGGCLGSMNIRLHHCSNIDILLANNQDEKKCIRKDYSVNMKIIVQMTNDCRCAHTDCLNNIQDGKCTDEFMINNFGKQFFPNKYAKQK